MSVTKTNCHTYELQLLANAQLLKKNILTEMNVLISQPSDPQLKNKTFGLPCPQLSQNYLLLVSRTKNPQAARTLAFSLNSPDRRTDVQNTDIRFVAPNRILKNVYVIFQTMAFSAGFIRLAALRLIVPNGTNEK